MVVGIAVAIAGLIFAWQPLQLARFVRWARMTPYPAHPSAAVLRYYRLSGLVVAAGGVLLAVRLAS